MPAGFILTGKTAQLTVKFWMVNKISAFYGLEFRINCVTVVFQNVKYASYN